MKMLELKQAEEINREIAQIPEAYREDICVGLKEVPEKDFKAIVVDNKVQAVVSDHYKLVQHREAFRPVIEGLTLRGIDKFNFSLWGNHRRAWLNIFVGEGFDTVKYGFRITNSVDRSTSVRYGLSAFSESQVLELVGYRQVCSNGMIVRVNLADAEIVKLEERIKIEQQLKQKIAFKHQGDMDKKFEEVQYIVEAFLLLEKPLERIIKKAQSKSLIIEQAKDFIKRYVGERKLDKIMELYGHEEQTLWGLYNAMTFYYSHRETLKATKLNTGLQKAAQMLEQELTVLA